MLVSEKGSPFTFLQILHHILEIKNHIHTQSHLIAKTLVALLIRLLDNVQISRRRHGVAHTIGIIIIHLEIIIHVIYTANGNSHIFAHFKS